MRTDGWTDRHDEANNRFSQFCECVYNDLEVVLIRWLTIQDTDTRHTAAAVKTCRKFVTSQGIFDYSVLVQKAVIYL